MRFRKTLSATLALAILGGSSAMADESSGLQAIDTIAVAGSGTRKELKKSDANRSKQTRKKAADEPLVEKYLEEGKLKEGETALAARLVENSEDDQARFGLGMLQFLRGIEGFAQDLRRYGIRDITKHGLRIPFLRIGVPNNPHPETLSYEKARKMAENLLASLVQAEATLSQIKDDNVKLPLHYGLIKLDLNGDGQLSDGETLWKMYEGLSRNSRVSEEAANKFTISFDRGDVHWLRGYCHLLSSVLEIYLAYDTRELLECTGQLFFSKIDTPYKFLKGTKKVRKIGREDLDIVDLIAFIHLIRFELADPQRMEASLHHMEAVVAQSRVTWKYIMAETDNDREWLPNPNQTGVANVHVTEEMVTSWGKIMDRIDKILAGEQLIPFWRGEEDGTGVNFRKVFLKPRAFDLVLWVQGPAAAPYLEKGPVQQVESWRKLSQSFGNNFPGFALWFN